MQAVETTDAVESACGFCCASWVVPKISGLRVASGTSGKEPTPSAGAVGGGGFECIEVGGNEGGGEDVDGKEDGIEGGGIEGGGIEGGGIEGGGIEGGGIDGGGNEGGGKEGGGNEGGGNDGCGDEGGGNEGGGKASGVEDGNEGGGNEGGGKGAIGGGGSSGLGGGGGTAGGSSVKGNAPGDGNFLQFQLTLFLDVQAQQSILNLPLQCNFARRIMDMKAWEATQPPHFCCDANQQSGQDCLPSILMQTELSYRTLHFLACPCQKPPAERSATEIHRLGL